jgi:hypothetical protein
VRNSSHDHTSPSANAVRSGGGTRLGVLALISLVATGCGAGGGGLDRKAISGEVTLDGRPLAAGSILFDPEAEGTGTLVGGLIRRGRFEVERAKGPVPGRYVVRIYASSGVQSRPVAGPPGNASRPMVELIPAPYNTQSTLHADVTANGPNIFDFAPQSTESPRSLISAE